MMSIIKAWNAILGRDQNVNATGNALHTLNEANAAIHQGEGFHFGRKFEMAPGAVVFFSGTPNSYDVHFDGLALDADTGPIEIAFYRHSVVSSGTAQSATNRKMAISSGSSMLIQQVATLTTTGDSVVPTVNLASPTIGGRSLPANATGMFDGFILASSETYLIGLHNTSADSATIWANFAFFEPTHR